MNKNVKKSKKTVSKVLKNEKNLECNKFKKAVRFEIPFTDIDFDKAKEESFKAKKSDLIMKITAKDFLAGLKKVKALKGTKRKKAEKDYLKEIASIYDDYGISDYWLDDDNSQYPAPDTGFYVNHIIRSISNKKFDLNESIKILDTVVKNEKVPFVKKKIPNVGVLHIFEENYFGNLFYEKKNYTNKKLLKKYVELVDLGCKLGSQCAMFDKACSFDYFDNCKKELDPNEAAKITEELIEKYGDYEALCTFGFWNNYIDRNKLIKYYKAAIKKGYNAYENLAKIYENEAEFKSIKTDKKKAMELRREAYNKYKKEYLDSENKQTNDFLTTNAKERIAIQYGYAAYNLGLALYAITPDINWDVPDSEMYSQIHEFYDEASTCLRKARELLKDKQYIRSGYILVDPVDYNHAEEVEEYILKNIDEKLKEEEY